MRGTRGVWGQGVRTPPPPPKKKKKKKKHKNIVGFFSNTSPDAKKITQLLSQQSMLGRHRNASETPLKRCQSVGPPSDKIFWICACYCIL